MCVTSVFPLSRSAPLALASFSAAAQHTHTHTHAHHTYTHARARTPPAPAAGHHALASTLSLPIDSLTAAASPRCCHAPTHPPPAFAPQLLLPLLFWEKAPGRCPGRGPRPLMPPTRQTTPRAATFARCQINAHASPLLAPTHHRYYTHSSPHIIVQVCDNKSQQQSKTCQRVMHVRCSCLMLGLCR